MVYSAEAILEAFWGAADDLGDLPPPLFLALLAGVCDRLVRAEPDSRLADEARLCREAAIRNGALLNGDRVRLAYSYSTSGDGLVELATFNAEQAEDCESGTVVGTPGVRLLFDEAEARRAIRILRSLFPGAE